MSLDSCLSPDSGSLVGWNKLDHENSDSHSIPGLHSLGLHHLLQMKRSLSRWFSLEEALQLGCTGRQPDHRKARVWFWYTYSGLLYIGYWDLSEHGNLVEWVDKAERTKLAGLKIRLYLTIFQARPCIQVQVLYIDVYCLYFYFILIHCSIKILYPKVIKKPCVEMRNHRGHGCRLSR